MNILICHRTTGHSLLIQLIMLYYLLWLLLLRVEISLWLWISHWRMKLGSCLCGRHHPSLTKVVILLLTLLITSFLSNYHWSKIRNARICALVLFLIWSWSIGFLLCHHCGVWSRVSICTHVFQVLCRVWGSKSLLLIPDVLDWTRASSFSLKCRAKIVFSFVFFVLNEFFHRMRIYIFILWRIFRIIGFCICELLIIIKCVNNLHRFLDVICKIGRWIHEA